MRMKPPSQETIDLAFVSIQTESRLLPEPTDPAENSVVATSTLRCLVLVLLLTYSSPVVRQRCLLAILRA